MFKQPLKSRSFLISAGLVLLIAIQFTFFVSAELPDASTIYTKGRGELFASNLKFDFTTGNNHILSEIGNVQLAPNGIIPLGYEELADGTFKYKTNLKLQVSANIYSAFTKDEIFKYDSSSKKSVTWCDLYTSVDPFSIKATYQQLKLDYYDYSRLPTSASSTYNLAKGIDKDITISASFSDITFRDQTSGDVTLQTKNWDAQIVQIAISNFETSEIAKYDTYYTSNLVEGLTVKTISDHKPSDSVLKDAIGTLGYRSRTSATQTFQQGAVTATTGICRNNRFHVKLRPDIKLQKETIKYTYREVAVDTQSAWLSPAGVYTGPCIGWQNGKEIWAWNGLPEIVGCTPQTGVAVSKTITRTTGWEVKNYNVHLDFEVEIYVESFVEVKYNTASDQDGVNAPSNVQQQAEAQWEDVINFNPIEGETGATLNLDNRSFSERLQDALGINTSAMMGSFALIIVLIVAIAAVGVVLYFKMQGAGMKKIAKFLR